MAFSSAGRVRRLSRILRKTNARADLLRCTTFVQHGQTSVLLHCIAVAYSAAALLDFLHIRYDEKALMRGALLHDFYLYDWHCQNRAKGEKLHAFAHADTAWKNAVKYFSLSPIEENVIRRHMFPVTLTPPTCREAVAVCIADKLCALKETFCKDPYPRLRAMVERLQQDERNHAPCEPMTENLLLP